MRYELSPSVEPDLERIGDFIAQHNQRRALSFVLEIQAHFEVVAKNPQGYRLRGDLGKAIRISPYGRYLIVFRILGDHVRIDRVVSGYRDLAEIAL